MVRFHRDRTGIGWLSGLLGPSREHILVSERCRYTPIQVDLDGFQINDPESLTELLPKGPVRRFRNPLLPAFEPFQQADVLVERNYLTSEGARLLAELPTRRSGRHLQFGKQRASIPDGRWGASGGRQTYGNRILLCDWLLPESQSQLMAGRGLEWASFGSGKPPAGSYSMQHYQNLMGAYFHLIGMDQEQMASVLSQVRPRSGLSISPFSRPPQFPLIHRRVTIPFGLAGPSRMIPILHGVALDPVDLPGLVSGLHAIVADDELTTDLSQLKVVDNQRLESLRQSIAEDAAEMIPDVENHLDSLRPKWVRDIVLKRLEELGLWASGA